MSNDLEKNAIVQFREVRIFVVVQFYPWFKFYFSLFWGMVIYDNEFRTKGNKIEIMDKIEPQHIFTIKAREINTVTKQWVIYLIVDCIVAHVFSKVSCWKPFFITSIFPFVVSSRNDHDCRYVSSCFLCARTFTAIPALEVPSLFPRITLFISGKMHPGQYWKGKWKIRRNFRKLSIFIFQVSYI